MCFDLSFLDDKVVVCVIDLGRNRCLWIRGRGHLCWVSSRFDSGVLCK
jgi:hypothetical protein